ERMLRYFGEPSPSPCGQCDICRALKARANRPTDVDLASRVLDYLRARPRGVRYDVLLAAMGSSVTPQVSRLVATMLQEGVASMDGPYLQLIATD
ncbi:MAG: RecQ family zinc-binding domain-containing protein, partial [Muribaculaceae bacterium]|nr:RecQ family zinc-binding domain-containing protein [Muribaculaceae bacterium]